MNNTNISRGNPMFSMLALSSREIFSLEVSKVYPKWCKRGKFRNSPTLFKIQLSSLLYRASK